MCIDEKKKRKTRIIFIGKSGTMVGRLKFNCQVQSFFNSICNEILPVFLSSFAIKYETAKTTSEERLYIYIPSTIGRVLRSRPYFQLVKQVSLHLLPPEVENCFLPLEK
jgi:hypothetical protein